MDDDIDRFQDLRGRLEAMKKQKTALESRRQSLVAELEKQRQLLHQSKEEVDRCAEEASGAAPVALSAESMEMFCQIFSKRCVSLESQDFIDLASAALEEGLAGGDQETDKSSRDIAAETVDELQMSAFRAIGIEDPSRALLTEIFTASWEDGDEETLRQLRGTHYKHLSELMEAMRLGVEHIRGIRTSQGKVQSLWRQREDVSLQQTVLQELLEATAGKTMVEAKQYFLQRLQKCQHEFQSPSSPEALQRAVAQVKIMQTLFDA